MDTNEAKIRMIRAQALARVTQSEQRLQELQQQLSFATPEQAPLLQQHLREATQKLILARDQRNKLENVLQHVLLQKNMQQQQPQQQTQQSISGFSSTGRMNQEDWIEAIRRSMSKQNQARHNNLSGVAVNDATNGLTQQELQQKQIQRMVQQHREMQAIHHQLDALRSNLSAANVRAASLDDHFIHGEQSKVQTRGDRKRAASTSTAAHPASINASSVLSIPPEYLRGIIQRSVAQNTTGDIDADVEPVLIDLMDAFIQDAVANAAKLAQHRKSNDLDLQDMITYLGNLFLFKTIGMNGWLIYVDTAYGIRIPGFALENDNKQ